MGKRLIMVVNPGSTSTKFSLYREENPVFEKTLRHTSDELSVFQEIIDQLHFRRNLIMEELVFSRADIKDIAVVMGRGGLIKPIESGIYQVNKKMKEDLVRGVLGEHASNLGGLIADEIASSLPNASAYIADPVVVDELQPVARISGHPELERISIFHALNQKAVARLYARSADRNYDELNLVIAHMGGGISVGAHRKGRVIDVNNALNGDGPFSPERTGGLPAGQLVDLCFSGKYSHLELKSMITGRGGMVAYLGTNDFIKVCQRAEEGEGKAKLVREAVGYQVGKEIGAMATVLEGKVDAIILTGGLAFQEGLIGSIKGMVDYIADVIVYPGEDEMSALAFNALLVLEGKTDIKTYK